MKIYLDLILLSNFLLDYSLISYTGMIAGRKLKFIRLFLATLFALSGFVLFFIPILWIFIILRILYSFVIILIAFPYVSFKKYVKTLILFYLLNYVIAGIIVSYNFNFKSQAISIEVNRQISWYLLLISFILANIITYTYKVMEERKALLNHHVIEVVFGFINKTYDVRGFIDTGNHVVSHGDQLPVVFVDRTVFDFEIDEQYLIRHNIKFTYIVANTVNEQSLLLAFRPNFFKIFIDGEYKEKKVYIAIGKNVRGKDFQVILNSNLEWGVSMC